MAPPELSYLSELIILSAYRGEGMSSVAQFEWPAQQESNV